MAFFRTDGTADIEQKKFYRDNGTADVQIDKIYRGNGTVDSLIYTAETVVVDTSQGVPVNTWKAAGYNDQSQQYTGSASATEGITLRVDNNYGGYTEQVARDFTNVDRITFVVSSRSAINDRLGTTTFGVSNKSNGQPYGGASWKKSMNVSSAGTFTLDTSDIEGTGYLALYQSVGGKVNMTKIVFE